MYKIVECVYSGTTLKATAWLILAVHAGHTANPVILVICLCLGCVTSCNCRS